MILYVFWLAATRPISQPGRGNLVLYYWYGVLYVRIVIAHNILGAGSVSSRQQGWQTKLGMRYRLAFAKSIYVSYLYHVHSASVEVRC